MLWVLNLYTKKNNTLVFYSLEIEMIFCVCGFDTFVFQDLKKKNRQNVVMFAKKGKEI